ncbi:MAG: hypothetical protein AAGC88_07730, partial [Bacteroidota bacterium]
RQSQVRVFDGLSVEVVIHVANRAEPIFKTIQVNTVSKEYSYLVNGQVEKVEIDPNRKLLFDGDYTKDARR